MLYMLYIIFIVFKFLYIQENPKKKIVMVIKNVYVGVYRCLLILMKQSSE